MPESDQKDQHRRPTADEDIRAELEACSEGCKKLHQTYARQLHEKKQQLVRFASIVSHDLRAPLVNIKGFVNELKEALQYIEKTVMPLQEQLGETQRESFLQALKTDIPESMGFIDHSIQRMDDQMQALLTLSRMQRNTMTIHEIDTPILVDQCLATYSTTLAEKDIEVKVHTLPQVSADRDALAKIFSHLVDNAIKFAAPDRPGRIEISGESGEQTTCFKVKDNGLGITPRQQEKIFDVFQRACAPEVPGHGMGLAYVRTLLERHGGTITCVSEEGQGSSFTFCIPRELPEDLRRLNNQP